MTKRNDDEKNQFNELKLEPDAFPISGSFLSYKNSVEHSNVTEKCPLSSLSVLSKLACYLKHCTIHLDFLGIGWLDMENGGESGQSTST